MTPSRDRRFGKRSEEKCCRISFGVRRANEHRHRARLETAERNRDLIAASSRRRALVGAALAAAALCLCACISPQDQARQECSGLQFGSPSYNLCYREALVRRTNVGLALIQAGTATAFGRPPTISTANCTRFGNNVNCVGITQ